MRIRDTSVDPHRTRRTQVWRDQHGRPWEVTVDTESMAPCVPPIPKFRAPLMPPLEYVAGDPDRLGRVKIAYERWLPDWAAEEERWESRRLVIATDAYGDAAATAIEQNLPELRRRVGVMPQSPEFVRAAMAGNRWVLGLPHPTPGKKFVPPELLRGLLDRLAPREATRADLDTTAVRARYADVDEDGETFTPAAPRAAREARTHRDPFAQSVPAGFGSATEFGDAAEDFDDEGFDAGDAAVFEDAEDEDLGDDAPVVAANMVRTRRREG